MRDRLVVLARAFEVAEGREQVAISAEMRQLEAAIAVEEERERRAEADAALAAGEDPVGVARVLLRELRAIALASPDAARELLAELQAIFPAR